jgi:predicted secreted protein
MFGRKMFAAIILAISSLGITPAYPSDSLGIGLTVIPINDGTDANLSFNNQLWFGIEQGKSFTRQFEVSSSSQISQRLDFKLFDVLYDNGTRGIRTDRASTTTPWVQFMPANVVLPPKGIARVSMTYQIPTDVDDSSYEAFLRVNASAANAPKVTDSKDEGGVRVVLAGSAAIDIPVWLGVGNPKNLISDFEIKKVFGFLDDGQKKLRVVIRNSGKTPLGLAGSVQLTDASFSDRNFGPYPYRSSEIQPGKEALIDIEMPEDVTEGKWKILVVAEQGSIRKSKVFDEDLTFKPLGSGFPLQILLVMLGVLGLLFGWRLFRTPTKTKSSNRLKISKAELIEKQLASDKLIAELSAQIEAEDSRAKKRTAKQSAPKKLKKQSGVKKKTSTSKRPKAKTPVKRTTTRKAAPKKKATKKAAVKRK